MRNRSKALLKGRRSGGRELGKSPQGAPVAQPAPRSGDSELVIPSGIRVEPRLPPKGMRNHVGVLVPGHQPVHHYRRGRGTRHTQSHVPVGRSKHGVPRQLQGRLPRRHDPTPSSPGSGVKGFQKGTRCRTKTPSRRHHKGHENRGPPLRLLQSSRDG